jgi:hypothetical protein
MTKVFTLIIFPVEISQNRMKLSAPAVYNVLPLWSVANAVMAPTWAFNVCNKRKGAWYRIHSTRPGHPGWCNTNRNDPICVAPPKVTKASTNLLSLTLLPMYLNLKQQQWLPLVSPTIISVCIVEKIHRQTANIPHAQGTVFTTLHFLRNLWISPIS